MSEHNLSIDQGTSLGDPSVAQSSLSNPTPPRETQPGCPARNRLRLRMIQLRKMAAGNLELFLYFIVALAEVVDDHQWNTALRSIQNGTQRCRKRLWSVFIVIGLLSVSARLRAQSPLPDAPEPKYEALHAHPGRSKEAKPKNDVKVVKVFDVETVIELEAVAASFAADAMSTQKLYEFPAVYLGHVRPYKLEGNPVARVFIGRNGSAPGTALYFASAFAADVYGTYWLRKHHHPWIARTLNLALIAAESRYATSNYRTVENFVGECVLHHPISVAGMPNPCVAGGQ